MKKLLNSWFGERVPKKPGFFGGGGGVSRKKEGATLNRKNRVFFVDLELPTRAHIFILLLGNLVNLKKKSSKSPICGTTILNL